MHRRTMKWTVVLAACAAIGLVGCNPGTASKKADSDHAHGDHDHGDHDHGEHAHVHKGPHGGKIMEIGEEEYHAEWLQDETGKVTFYILDAAGTKEVPIAADEITIEVKIGDKPPVSYKLTAINPQDMKASAFEIVDKNFEGVLGALSEGVTATIKSLKIGDKTFENVKIEEHKH